MIDGQLLEGFVRTRDPAAFRDLVARHGPSVLRVCRGLLHDPHEAEDALQATFLILVRRAPSIRDPERLDAWLVGVARKVAARARRRGVVRSERERKWAAMHPEARESDRPLDDIRRVVREEIDRLPESYRQPLALCYLEGLTHEEAAERLGWPVGTVKTRLARARGRLRDRLDRRGLGLSVAFLLLCLHREASAGLISAGPLASTADIVELAASGQAAALEARYPRAVEFARGLGNLYTPFFRRTLAIFLLLASLVATSGLAAAYHAATNRGEAAAMARLVKVLGIDCR